MVDHLEVVEVHQVRVAAVAGPGLVGEEEYGAGISTQVPSFCLIKD
jgi:hypothetical protein